MLPNGNVILPEFVEIPPDLARRVRGGTRGPKEKLPPLISDDFIEVNRAGEIVKRTSLWSLLDPVKDPIGPLERRWEWTHTNSVDLTGDGHLLFSCRTNSRLGILDREQNAITWKYGAPNTFYQHHATSLPNGNVLIFDNGMNRFQDLSYSRVIEVNPKDNAVAWQYEANPRQQFFSGHISGAHRLPNGNTLICEGTSGRVFEVTAAHEIAWEWINPMHHTMGPCARAGSFAPTATAPTTRASPAASSTRPATPTSIASTASAGAPASGPNWLSGQRAVFVTAHHLPLSEAAKPAREVPLSHSGGRGGRG